MQFLLILLFGMAGAANAQPPDSVWSCIYECAQSYRPNYRLLPTGDGSYLLSGQLCDSIDGSYQSGVISKVDSLGNLMWIRDPSGDDQNSEVKLSIPLDHGDYGWVGVALDWQWNVLWWGRSDSNGTTLWQHDIVADAFLIFPTAGIACQDGSYVCVSDRYGGQDDHGIWIMRTTGNGDVVWSRDYSSPEPRSISSIIETGDGDFVLAGSTGSEVFYETKGFVMRLDSSGDSLWTRVFDLSLDDALAAISFDAEGGFYVAGRTDNKFWLMRLDANGDSLWSRTYTTGWAAECYDVIKLPDGGLLLAGTGSHSYALFRVTADGDSVWSQTFTANNFDFCLSAVRTLNGGFLLSGITETDFAEHTYGVWLIRTGPDPLDVLNPQPLQIPGHYILSQNYPNPFNAATTITFELPRAEHVVLSVFDITGRMLETIADNVMSAGTHQLNWDASALPSGIYVYRLESASFTQSRKMVVLK